MSSSLGFFASQISGHLFTLTGSYDALATVTVPSGGASSITFSAIPQTGYKHLQIRLMVNGTSGTQDVYTQFNGDTGSNYSFHGLYGSGSTAAAYGSASQTKISTGVNLAGYGSGSAFSVGIIDLLDYSASTKYKTLRVLNGFDTNAGTTNINNESIALASGAWLNTSAITSIYMYPSGGSFAQFSQFSLYGIK